ncbi:MAG TPA: M13 family metallopeptidase, partial [Tepidisphaeraceae bacterium]|nr:M13 family metallopeptidase [Tepidisphaeraceae bacterium]
MRKLHALVTIGLLVLGPSLCPAEDAPARSGIDRANFDISVSPGQDFFEYVNGNWIKTNPIPPDYSRWGSFSELHERDLQELKQIFDQLQSAGSSLDEDQRKLRDFYTTAMDEAKLQREGASPLKTEFDKIAAISNADDLARAVAHLHSVGITPLFGFRVGQDEKNSAQYIVSLSQGGLSLPERNYYVAGDADSKAIRAKFHDHVVKMLRLLGDSEQDAAAGADVVMDIETKLAEKSRTPVQLRDVEKRYNKKTRRQLDELCPNFNWELYLKTLGVKGEDDVIVGEPEFLQRANELLSSVPMQSWKTYLRWHLLDDASPYLSDDFVNESFEFSGRTLRGQKQIEARWKRAAQAIDRLMGEDLGKIYVDRYFPPEAKRRMQDLVHNIIEAYRERIRTRDWMSENTKQQALAKLDKVMRKIAYPDKWRDYSSLQISTDSYVQNVIRARVFNFEYRLSKLGGPIDRGEWGMTPPTVNAYYNPTMNEIVFPAGILQPPFFNRDADDAVNYGAIGAVIGHELTHGFDDQGSHYDADGNMKNWWTPEDKKRFNGKTEALAGQYDRCVALDDLHVNGHLTLGENLADLGGLTIALAAYHRSL